MATQRLFFALWPDPALQAQIHARAHALMQTVRARPLTADNLHLTLVFLGSVDATVRACLGQGASALRGQPFELVLDQAGYWGRPQVLWLGASRTPSALLDLVDGLQTAMRACGLTPESRPYAAHVTVARKIRHDPGPLAIAPLRWPVAGFALVESRGGPGGVRYLPLRTWAF